jgi:chemotaxis protein CheD
MSVKAKAWGPKAAESGGTRTANREPQQPALKEIYLHPGQTAVSREPACISMVLGSCVGVCLFDPELSVGGATHYMLAKWSGMGQPSSRYGDIAIKTLIEQLRGLGSKTSDLRAMVFGGARMFEAFRREDGEYIGIRNANIAMELLDGYAIAIVTKNVGGNRGRKLKMQTDTGAIVVTLIGSR